MPRFSTKFIASVFLVGLLSMASVVYGTYRYYRTPLPPFIATSGSWFAEGYKGADIYIAVKVKNYSDAAVDSVMQSNLFVFGEPVPVGLYDRELPNPMKSTFAPWSETTVSSRLKFQGGQDLIDAYRRNAIRMEVTVTYNNGSREVTYRYVGRIDSRTATCGGCAGNIDILVDETE